MKRYILILIGLGFHALAMATITMHITPTTARPGETLQLTLTQHDNHQSHDAPDLSPLKQDFTVIGTQHAISYTVNNGTASSENQWTILLIPKTSGILRIPAIKMGQQYSPAGEVNITLNTPGSNQGHSQWSQQDDTQAEPSDEHHAVTLHTEVSEDHPFINQQIMYTVKLTSNQSLLEAQYQPPHVDNALLIPLGDGRRYHTTLNGQEYTVDEQKYAIYPQNSGALQISPPQLTAVVYNTLPQRIRVNGNPIQLTVKPAPPTSTNQPWLPAKQVSLSEQYDSSRKTMHQGSTLVRHIQLQAVGLPAELLPPLSFANSKHYSVYPEKPETRNALRQQELIGSTTVAVTYILNQSGLITLPAIEIPWFNTETGHKERATLPARTITVTGTGAGNKPTHPATHPKASMPPPMPLAHTESPKAPSSPLYHHAWIAITVACLALLVAGLCWVVYHHRSIKVQGTPKKSKPTLKPSVRSSRLHLRTACANQDPKQALAALLNWGREQWPDEMILHLNELNRLLSDPLLNQQINLLSEALYAPGRASRWDGKALWQAVKQYHRPAPAKHTSKGHHLPPINPDLGAF